MKIKTLFYDRWIYLNFFIIYQLLCTVPMLYTYLNKFSKLFLLWGTIIIFFSMANKCQHKQKELSKILAPFFVWYFMVILFYPNFQSNFKLLYYLFIQVFIIFCVTKNENVFRNKVEFIKLIKRFIFFTFLGAFISFGIYLFRYENIFIYNNTAYNLGYSDGRLGGIYGNPNILSILADISLIFSLALVRKNPFYLFNILAQILCIILSYSRGSITAIILGVTFAGYSLLLSKYKNTWGKIFLFILCLPIMLMLYLSVDFSAKQAQNFYALNLEDNRQTQYVTLKDTPLPAAPPLTQQEECRGSNTNNARLELLILGVKVFRENPLTGVGIMNIGKSTEPYLTKNSSYLAGDPILNNPHNTPVQILASSGLIGFLLILIFAFKYLKIVFYRFRQCSSSAFYTCLFALELMLLFNSLFEWYIFMNSSVLASIFWLVSSELLIFSPQESKEGRNK